MGEGDLVKVYTVNNINLKTPGLPGEMRPCSRKGSFAGSGQFDEPTSEPGQPANMVCQSLGITIPAVNSSPPGRGLFAVSQAKKVETRAITVRARILSTR